MAFEQSYHSLRTVCAQLKIESETQFHKHIDLNDFVHKQVVYPLEIECDRVALPKFIKYRKMLASLNISEVGEFNQDFVSQAVRKLTPHTFKMLFTTSDKDDKFMSQLQKASKTLTIMSCKCSRVFSATVHKESKQSGFTSDSLTVIKLVYAQNYLQWMVRLRSSLVCKFTAYEKARVMNHYSKNNIQMVNSTRDRMNEQIQALKKEISHHRIEKQYFMTKVN